MDKIWTKKIKMTDRIITITEFLSKDECEVIIKKCLDELDLLDAKTYSESNVVKLSKKEIRKSKVAFIDDLGHINNLILSKVMEEVKIKGFEPSIETFQFTKYNEGDYFDWHIDRGETMFKDRFYTIVIQLNENYTGGDFELMINNKKSELEFGVGNLYVFPSNVFHRVKPIQTGNRYSLVSWLKLKEIENHKKTLL
jgi:predicted 2-oxoglutarate/Fe(II)-dependent dioxygenase YbiX